MMREREGSRFFFVFTTSYDTFAGEIGIFTRGFRTRQAVDVRKFGDIDRA